MLISGQYSPSVSLAGTDVFDRCGHDDHFVYRDGVCERRRAVVWALFVGLNWVWTPSPPLIIGQWRALVVHRIVVAEGIALREKRIQHH